MSVPALGTTDIGTICYYRAPGCTAVVLTDILPYLSKIIHYDDDGGGGAEYIDAELPIYKTGTPNATDEVKMVRVRIRADGYILAWLMRSDYVLATYTGATYINTSVIDLGVDTANQFDYPQQYNKTLCKLVSGSPAVPHTGEYHMVASCDAGTNYLTTSANNFTTGSTYEVELYHSNAELQWWNNTHPLENSTILARACYEIWLYLQNSATVSATPSAAIAPFIQPSNWYPGMFTPIKACFQYDLSLNTYVNYTTAANNATVADVVPFPAAEAIGDIFYVGFDGPVQSILFNVSTAGTVGVVTAQIYNKDTNAWTNTTAYTADYGTIHWKATGYNIYTSTTFDAPQNMGSYTVNGVTAFWVRFVVSTVFTVNPIITQIWAQPEQDYMSPSYKHYNYEYPSATHLMVAYDYGGQTIFLYFTQLPWHTIYSICYTSLNGSSVIINDTLFSGISIAEWGMDLNLSPGTDTDLGLVAGNRLMTVPFTTGAAYVVFYSSSL